MRILVVDDNQDGARTTARVLAISKHLVQVAFNGAVAVKEAALLQPEVVLLDISMSGIDGYETCRIIRKMLGDKVYIIAITGWGSVEDRQRSRDAGFDEHLLIPVDWKVLKPLLLTVEASAKNPGGPEVETAE